MSAATARKPVVYFVGSIPLSDAETVFRTLAAATGPYLKRLPDGETGIRKTWIRFLQQVLADNPAIEVASDVPPFKFTQWDGKLLREIPRLRVKPGARLDPATVKTGYAIWRSRDLELDAGGDDAFLLQAVEQLPRLACWPHLALALRAPPSLWSFWT